MQTRIIKGIIIIINKFLIKLKYVTSYYAFYDSIITSLPLGVPLILYGLNELFKLISWWLF